MKRVSAKLFFHVIWRGICQSLSWFFGLFGYKHDGIFLKCIWGVFATCVTIIVALIAGALLCTAYHDVYDSYSHKFCNGDNCHWTKYISRNVRLHDHYDGNMEIINTKTGKVTMKGIEWISKPLGERDSLVVFSNGKKRGYFNKYTGEVVIPAKYDHAWVFSDGIASVEENDRIKFIDSNGKQIFPRTLPYDPNHEGYVFHAGCCVVDENEDKKVGLMDTLGNIVIAEEYDDICISNSQKFWRLSKGEEMGVLNKDLTPIIPMLEGYISVWDDCIDVTMADNTMRKYDFEGNLIDDCYISAFDYLEYELEDTYQIVHDADEEYGTEKYVSIENKKTRARLCKYSSGNGVGLMTAEGHIITPPRYLNISAIGPDTYLCEVSHGDKEILNGKGQKVR